MQRILNISIRTSTIHEGRSECATQGLEPFEFIGIGSGTGHLKIK